MTVVDTLKVFFCEVRERVSGGIKPVSHDLRTTSSKTKKVVHISLGVHRQVVSISGTTNRQAAEECLVRIQRKVVTVHLRQPTIEVSHLQNIIKVVAAPFVVLRQVLAIQQGDVSNSGGTLIESHFVAQNVVVLSNIVVEIAFLRWSRTTTVQVVQKTLEIPFVQCWGNIVGLLVVGQSRPRRCRVCSKR